MGLAHTQRTWQAPFFIKNIPYRYSSYGIKNMSKGITSLKINKCPQAYKLKRDKVPVIPFLSLSSGGRSKRRKGKKGAPRRATGGRRHQENISVTVRRLDGDGTPEAELEDEAAGC